MLQCINFGLSLFPFFVFAGAGEAENLNNSHTPRHFANSHGISGQHGYLLTHEWGDGGVNVKIYMRMKIRMMKTSSSPQSNSASTVALYLANRARIASGHAGNHH